MDERLTALWQAIEPRLRIIMFALFAVFLAFIFYLKFAESTAQDNLVSSPPAPQQPRGNSQAADAIRAIVLEKQAKPIEETEYASLISNSMFNVKMVLDEVEKDRRAQGIMTEAQALVAQGQNQQALEKVNQVLSLRPAFLGARQLRDELQKRIGGAPEADGAQPPE